eukprot:g12902.t1
MPMESQERKEEAVKEVVEDDAASEDKKGHGDSKMKVPTTFREMFLFNAAVMGFGNSKWMDIILDQLLASVNGNSCSSGADGSLEVRPVAGNTANTMHLKRMMPQPEPPLIFPDFPVRTEKVTVSKDLPGGSFVDKEFPAAPESIGGVTGDDANPNVGKYLQDPGTYKLQGVTGEPCLFKHASPRDIEQGYLGDCWLVSSFSALAEYPDRVRSLFKQKELAEERPRPVADGRYDIRLYCPHEEEWKVITIDDRIPYWQRPGRYGQPCFAKPTKERSARACMQENEFWPCLLEKACAKLVKAYYRLDGGFEAVALEMLTGKPAISFQLSLSGTGHQPFGIVTGPDDKHLQHATVYMRLKGMDANWGYWGQDHHDSIQTHEYDKDGYSIACGSRGNYQGILAGHAYTILRFLDVEVTRNGKKETLLLMHVRNPHATNELRRARNATLSPKTMCTSWEGTWNAYPEALKATGHKIGVKDNGHGFSEIAVCFDKRDPGRRYKDTSAAAEKEHGGINMGPTGHQSWEECDVLLLVLSKYTEPISLSDFRAVMLATLRSLAPKDWDTEHEVAWNWLWENIERVLKGQLGKPKALERALTHFIASWSEDQAMFFRKELYKRFFAFSPSGQDFFKQSSTRLYFLADRVVEMTVEMFREPRKMVQEISGLGLRHVGWGIPPELFGPYTSGAVESVRCMTTDENTQAAFRFSLSLIAKILVRAVTEGGTLVMRAINTNQELALKKAIAIAPRGKRAMELLNISVGTQSISPLFWSIESGSLNSARAMIVDLLTIRADRDVYYYGCDAMFTRHPDLILRLCNDASTLLWTLFDGLVWRSRLVQDGQRRVNYYIKHLVQDLEGNLSPALKWLAHHKDPRLVSHGVVMTFADLLWNRVASYQFLLGRGYFLFTLLIFITSQSLLVPGEEALWRNITTFVCRCFLYLGSMSKLLFDQCKLSCSAFKAGEYQWYWLLPVPNYLHSTQQAGSLLLVLLLILMLLSRKIWNVVSPCGMGKPAAETAETIRAAPERGNVAEEAPEAPDCDGNVAELELEPVGILQRSRTLEAWDLELAALVCF